MPPRRSPGCRYEGGGALIVRTRLGGRVLVGLRSQPRMVWLLKLLIGESDVGPATLASPLHRESADNRFASSALPGRGVTPARFFPPPPVDFPVPARATEGKVAKEGDAAGPRSKSLSRAGAIGLVLGHLQRRVE